MVSEIESPLDDAVLDDEDVVADEPTDEVDTEDSVESLRADINALKAQLERPSWLNELKTIEGRVRSAEARLQRAESPEQQAALRSELETRINESNTLIQAMLAGIDDSAFIDPSVKARAQQYIAQQQQAAHEAALIQRVRNEIQGEAPRQAPANNSDSSEWPPEVQVWERTRVKQIQKAGLDPDGEDWAPVWRTAAAALVQGDFDTADEVIDSHLASLVAERTNAMERNVRKRQAKGSPAASGGAKGALDPSRSSADRIAYLRSIGAL